MNLHEAQEPIASDAIGIAIKSDVSHVGFLFWREGSGTSICDFQRDKHLNVGSLRPGYFWIQVSLEVGEAAAVASLLELIIRRHNERRIPYSLRYELETFDIATGLIREGRGLTCASFIVAVFDTLSLSIIDASTWRARPREDKEFRDALVAAWIGHGPENDDAIIRLMSEKIDFRIKPAEVAGAGTATDFPVSFAKAKILAQQLTKAIDSKAS